MSLINQMLRDLKNRQESGDKGKPVPLRSNVSERIPYLPAPVVLGGAAVLLVLLVWWLAGALSEALFRFEPAAGPAATEMTRPQDDPTPVPAPVVAVAEREMLTSDERAAEPLTTPVIETAREVVSAPAVQAAEVITAGPAQRPASVPAPPVKPEKPITRVAASPVAEPQAVVRTVSPSPVIKEPARPVRKVEPAPAQTESRRLHPDDLPGAIMSSSREISVRRPAATRVAPLPASPFGAAELAYQDGIWARDQRRSSLAARSLQQALEIYPGHLPARMLLVEIFAEEGKTGEAMFLLAEGLEIAPDYLPFKKLYARLLIEQGDYEAAAKALLSGGLPAVEEDPETHVILASVYQRLGEAFLAAQTYRNLLVAWPRTGAFWVGLGGALEAQRLPEEAIECYRRALDTENLRQDLGAFATRRLGQLD